MIYQSEEGLKESGALFPCLFFLHTLSLSSHSNVCGTCPRQEVFENTNGEFIWALGHARIFYHIFRESLPYPCFRILLACNEYLLPLSGLGFFAVGYGWLVNERKEGRSGYPCSYGPCVGEK